MKKQDIILLIIVVIVAVLTICFFVIPEIENQNAIVFQNDSDTWDSSYESKYFDPDTVNTLNIIIDERYWNMFVNSPLSEKYIPCTIELNSDIYSDVKIRTCGAGGTLYNVLETYEDTERYSFKFKRDNSSSDAGFSGLDKFVVRNMAQDASYSKDYLCYELAKKLGISSPDYSYVKLYLNGEYFGLYLMLECVDSSFVHRNYGNKSVQIYQPTLVEYKGDDMPNYYDIWKSLVFGTPTDEDKVAIINAIKQISAMSDISECVDINAVIAYFSMMSAVVNTDSFVNGNNYFLSNVDGRLSLIPWDNDLAFGAYKQNSTSQQAINFPIDTPVINTDFSGNRTLEHYPLLNDILSSDIYKEKYHSLLKDIATYFLGDYMAKRIDEIDSLIGEDVKADPTKFVSYDEYKKAQNNLKTFGYLRAESILGQLNGTIPSTWDDIER